jgi:predicted nucleic acid-binding Zn ribbon protein
MPGKPEAIGGILATALKGLGLQRYFDGWRAVSEWPAIVGEVTAGKAEAVRYDDGVLVVAVADDSWRQQLSLQREEILALVRKQPYGHAVEQIRLERGEKGRRL